MIIKQSIPKREEKKKYKKAGSTTYKNKNKKSGPKAAFLFIESLYQPGIEFFLYLH